jgi:hypothetical protein
MRVVSATNGLAGQSGWATDDEHAGIRLANATTSAVRRTRLARPVFVADVVRHSGSLHVFIELFAEVPLGLADSSPTLSAWVVQRARFNSSRVNPPSRIGGRS